MSRTRHSKTSAALLLLVILLGTLSPALASFPWSTSVNVDYHTMIPTDGPLAVKFQSFDWDQATNSYPPHPMDPATTSNAFIIYKVINSEWFYIPADIPADRIVPRQNYQINWFDNNSVAYLNFIEQLQPSATADSYSQDSSRYAILLTSVAKDAQGLGSPDPDYAQQIIDLTASYSGIHPHVDIHMMGAYPNYRSEAMGSTVEYLEVTFNTKVDRASVEKAFWCEIADGPGIQGWFEWEAPSPTYDNSMYIDRKFKFHPQSGYFPLGADGQGVFIEWGINGSAYRLNRPDANVWGFDSTFATGSKTFDRFESTVSSVNKFSEVGLRFVVEGRTYELKNLLSAKAYGPNLPPTGVSLEINDNIMKPALEVVLFGLPQPPNVNDLFTLTFDEYGTVVTREVRLSGIYNGFASNLTTTMDATGITFEWDSADLPPLDHQNLQVVKDGMRYWETFVQGDYRLPWENQNYPGTSKITAVWAEGPDFVFVCGENGLLSRHGDNLDIFYPPMTTWTLNAIDGVNTAEVWSVGDGGSVLRYDGMAWTNPVPAATTTLAAIDFQGVAAFADNDVWMVGSNQSIVHYDGTDFTIVMTGEAGKRLNVIKGFASNNIYAAGDDGAMFHYDGTTWAPMPSGQAINIQDIWGFPTGDLWAVGSSATATGMVIRYIPPLAQWQEVATGSGYGFNTIWGFTSTDLYIAGDSGLVMHWNGSAFSAIDHTGIGDGTIDSMWGFEPNDIVFVGGNSNLNPLVLAYSGPHQIKHYAQRYFGPALSPGHYEWHIESGTPDDHKTITSASFDVAGVQMFSHWPDDMSTGIATNQAIDLYFNAPMNRLSVQNAFRVMPMVPGAMPLNGSFTWVWDENTHEDSMTWTPSFPYPMGTTIEVVLGLPEFTAFDMRNFPVENQPRIFRFMTAGGAVANGPVVISHVPGNNHVNIPTDTTISIYFDKAIDPATLGSGMEVSYTTPAMQTPFIATGTWTYLETTFEAAFTFDTLPLPFDADVTVRVNSLTGASPDFFPAEGLPYFFHFITRKPVPEIVYYWPDAPVAGVDPVVPPTEHVAMDFSGNVDMAMVEARFRLERVDMAAPMPVTGTFEWGTGGSSHFNFMPMMPLEEGGRYTATLMPPVNDIYGNGIPLPTSGFQFSFVVAQTSVRLFAVNPYTVKTGQTWVLSVHGSNLMTPEFTVMPEYDSGVQVTGVVSVTPDFTGASIEIHVDDDTWSGMRDLKVTNGEGSEFTLFGAFEIEKEAYQAFAQTLTLQNPADPSNNLLGVLFNMELDWAVDSSVASIVVKGPNLPLEGITLEKEMMTTYMPLWSRRIVFPTGVTPEVGHTYTFTVNPDSAAPVMRTAAISGFFSTFATDLAPANGVSVEDFAKPDFFSWNHPMATDIIAGGTAPNVFGMANCIVVFTPTDGTSTGVTIETPLNVGGPFAVHLDPGKSYNISVDADHDGTPEYTLTNLFLPGGGLEPAVFLDLPGMVSPQTPFQLCVVPDRTQPDTQGNIWSVIGFSPTLDFNNITAAVAANQAGESLSQAGLTPYQIFEPGTTNPIGNPYMAATMAVPGFPNPTPPAAGVLSVNPLNGFAVLVEQLEFVNGEIHPRQVWFNFYDYEWMYRDQITGKFTSSYYGAALYPGMYRWWLLTEDNNGNLSGTSAMFEVPAFASYTHIPADGATGIDGALPIEITFSTLMDTYSIDNTFVVFPEGANQPIQGFGNWEIMGDAAMPESQYHVYRWSPSIPLAPGVLHHVSAGRPDWPIYTQNYKPVAPIHFAYTVGEATGIYVVSSYPGNMDSNVPENTVISISFNTDMEAASTAAAVSMVYKDAAGGTFMPVSINVNVIGSTITLFPFAGGVQQPLMAGTEYQVIVASGAKASDGSVYDRNFFLNFKTFDPNSQVYPPYVMDTIPKFNAINVPVTGKFTVMFNEPMKIVSMASGITSNPPIQATMETPTSLNPTSFTFAPSQSLAPNTKYTITISQSVQNSAGVAMGYPYQVEFTTGSSTLTADDPIVEGTVPENSALSVPEFASIFIHFNKAMDHTATEAAVTIAPAVTLYKSWNSSPDGTGGETLILAPSAAAPFAYNTRYKVTVSTAAKDTNARALPAAYSFEFTTAQDYNTTIPPMVMFNSPGNGDTFVPSMAKVNVVFNKPMNKTLVESSTSVIRKDVTPAVPIPGAFVWYSEAMEFTPQVPFPAGALIEVTVAKTAQDANGLAITSDFISSFTVATETGTGTQAPRILATVPVTNSTAIPTSAYVTISFDMPMDRTATQNAIRFSPAVNGTWIWSGNTATMQPAAPLALNTLYSVTISTAAMSVDGVPISAENLFKFTTAATGSTNPVVVATMPSSGTFNVPLNTSINIGFSKDMDRTATETAITITPALSGKTFQWAATGLNIIPTTALLAGTKYTVYVSTGAKDVNSNSLGSAYTFNFTTSSSSAPTVVSTIPGNGAAGVPMDSAISLTFSADMRPLITEQSIIITPAIDGYWSWVGKTAKFMLGSATGATGLMGDTFYTVTVASTAVSVDNVPMIAPYTFSFFTAAPIASTPPIVKTVMPASGLFGVPTTTRVVVNFDRPMNPLATEPAFMLASEDETAGTAIPHEPVTGTISWLNDYTTMIFTPTMALTAGSFYEVIISESAMSAKSEPLMPWMSYFQTQFDASTATNPFVTTTMPPNGVTGVPVDAPYTMVFSTFMNTASVESAISVVPAVTTPVFTWYDNNSRVEIKPGAALSLDTLYTISIPANTAAAADGSFLSPFTSTFRTMATAAGSNVTVVGHTPAANATNIPLSARIDIAFSAPMKEAVTTQSVSFTDSTGPVAGATITWPEPYHMVITPPSTVKAGTSYTVTIAGTAEAAIGGATLGTPYTFAYTTIDTSGSLVIMATTPISNATNFATTGSIEISFSKEMTKVLAESAFSITPFTTGSFEWVKMTDTAGALTAHKMKFRPLNGFAKGTLYTVRVGTMAKSLDLSSLSSEYLFNFTTAYQTSDDVKVISSAPFNGMEGVAVDAPIVIYFNTPMDKTLTQGAILSTPAMAGMAYEWSTDQTRLLIKHNNFTEGTRYVLTVSNAAKSSSGTSMIPFRLEFAAFKNTANDAPEVASTMPLNGSTGFNAYGRIAINFNKTMAEAEIPAGQVTLVPDAGGVSAYWEDMNRTLAIYPMQKLKYKTQYTVTVGTGILDPDGKGLAASHSFSFTTETGPLPPTVLSIQPANNATGVSTASRIVINFSQYMDITKADSLITVTPAIANSWPEWWGTTLIINHEGLTAGAVYNIAIGASLESDMGVPMGTAFTSTFTASSSTVDKPIVVFSSPYPSQTDVEPYMPIDLEFNRPMNTASVESAFSITPQVTGNLSWFGSTSLSYSAIFKEGTAYTITIANTARDFSGITMEAFTLNFTTMGAATARAPKVLATIPRNTAFDVPLKAKLIVSFTEAMNPLVTEPALSILPETSGSFLWMDPTTVAFIPSSAFKATTKYSVTVKNTAASAAGATLEASYGWTFTTGALTGKPVVASVLPTPGFSSVPRTTSISAAFNMPMNPFSTESAFSIEPAVEGTMSWVSDLTMMFKPTAILEAGKIYKVKISTGASAINGATLEAPYEWSFTTGYGDGISPVVVFTAPYVDQTDVPVDAGLSILFSHAMDPVETQKAVTVIPPVQGSFTWLSDRELSFDPTSDLAKESTYWVTIGTGAKSTGGVALSSSYTYSFSTIGTSTASGPAVVSTVPAADSVDIAKDAQVVITFDSFMDKNMTESQLVIEPPVNGVVQWSETATASVMTFIPNGDGYPAGATILFRVLGFSDTGEPMAEAYEFTFDTKVDDISLPFVTYTNPMDGQNMVAPETNVMIGFSEPMDTVAAAGKITINYIDPVQSQTAGQPVEVAEPAVVTWSADGFTASIVLGDGTAPVMLTAGRTYTVVVDNTVADLSANPIGEDYFFTFTVAIDQTQVIPGTKRWDVTLSGDLSHSAMGSFGGVYVSSADGSLHAVNPDGTVKWVKTPAGITATRVSAPSVIKEDGVIVYTVNDTAYGFKADGTVAGTLTSAAGENILGPVAIDNRKSMVFARNGATTGTVVCRAPDNKLELWKYALTEKIAFPVTVNRNNNFVVITESGKLYELAPNGQPVTAQPYDLGAAASAAPAIGDNIYVSVGNKVVAVSNGAKVWEAEVAPTGQTLVAPVIANGIIFVGSSTADGTQGGFFALKASTGSLVDTYADAAHALDAGVTIPAMAMGDVTYFAAGKKLYALSGTAATFTVAWVFDIATEFTTSTNIIGMGYNKAGDLFIATAGGRLVSVFGTMAPDLSKLTWPKYMGNRHNSGTGINNMEGFIKGANSEVVPFQAKLGAETEFTAYASVTYASSDVPDFTMALLDPTLAGAAPVAVDENSLVDTIVVSMPTYYTGLAMVRVQNLLGDVLGATIETDTARNALIAKLHQPIYDSPSVLFRGVKITFKATAPASMPTDVDNKVKVFLGSAVSGNFIAAAEGDGDAGGQIVRNSLKVELVSDGSEAGATITEAWCEVQPKSIAANAGGKDSAGAVVPMERYSVYIKIPQTAKINPKGVNVIAVTVPKGMVVGGVAVSKNNSPLTRNTDYKVRYTNGAPVYLISLTNSIRQVDLLSKAMTLKVEFTVSTPNTTWMSVMNCSLSYINDLDKFFGAVTSTAVLIALEPYAVQPGEADGTAKNGDDNLLVVKPKNTAPDAKDLSPLTDVEASAIIDILWDSKDADSFVEYRLFYSTKGDLNLVTTPSTDAVLITGRYPVFDGRMLKEYSATDRMKYVWKLSEKNIAGEYVIPEGRYYIYAIADDGVNPPKQIISKGRVTVKRATNNVAPTFAFTGLAAGEVAADANASIDFTVTDTENDPVTVELYFYPVQDNLRAYRCLDSAGAVVKTANGAAGSPLTWYTGEVPDGKYYVLAWYSDLKHPGTSVWSTNPVNVTHAPVTGNEPPSYTWVNPDASKPMPFVQTSMELAWTGSDADDSATATVSLYYNKTQAEDTDLTLIVKNLKLSTNKYKWDTSSMKNGFYYVLAKVKENKAGTVTPTLRFWADIPVFVDLAKVGGLGQVKVSNLSATSVDVYFRSSVPTTGKVKYGINGVTNLSGTDAAGVARNHKVSITGLSPSTTYYYLVEATGDGATYVLDNGGELYSFRTLATAVASETAHWIGGDTGVPNAMVTIYMDNSATAGKELGSLATPSLSQPIVVQTDATGKWSANVANAIDSTGKLVGLSSTSSAKVEVLSEDGKTATNSVAISNVGAHTTSTAAVAASVGTLSSKLSHTVTLAKGFNLVALPLTPSTTITAKQFLVKAGENAQALYHFDVTQGRYKSVFRLGTGSNIDTDFLGTDFDLDLVKGFFVKMAADGSVILEGTKLDKPQPLALLKGFNMLTVGYGKDFPFSVKTGTTAIGFLKKGGNDAKAIYSFENGRYKTVFRLQDGTDASAFYAPEGDFDLLSGKSYFFKMQNATAVTPTADGN
ncbi:MAG: hypothetical protein CVV64_14795 [Candidatus Wallbacteria bacterium HGW-Wallbacteria-1]|jgi:hypothetical protein|uniref:SbsA Ig-like domain-containing protein n=1 Tax=Candidatus Wallbacteria bacterium HGW-Wallbacteria-1 TaxID=2013854 RepID=A0A2N1PLX3_9BACT|nr:MAG: hypothetical protein CVV64_14795 [Candidatus Wallbacteria bacterium HGW-Wallbacteria-1]